MKKTVLALLSLLICLCVVSCGAASSYPSFSPDNAYRISEGTKSVYAAADMADGGFSYAMAEVAQEKASAASDAPSSEKMVYYSTVSMETSEFTKASNALHRMIETYHGIIANENVYDLGSNYSRLNMTVRVPQENYNAFLDGLSADYHVVSVSNRVDNMTEAYYDNENRLKAYRVQEERLLQLLAKADTVSDMLEIEARLCDVQYEIESLTNTQRKIDNDVKYATFTLNLSEVVEFTDPAPRTFGDRLSDAFKASVSAFRAFAEGLLFALIFVAPYLIILLGIALCVILPLRAAARRKKKAATAAEQTANAEQTEKA